MSCHPAAAQLWSFAIIRATEQITWNAAEYTYGLGGHGGPDLSAVVAMALLQTVVLPRSTKLALWGSTTA